MVRPRILTPLANRFVQQVDWNNPLAKDLLVAGHANARWVQKPPTLTVVKEGLAISGASSAQLQGRIHHKGGEPVEYGVESSTIFCWEYFTIQPAWNSGSFSYGDCSSAWPNDEGLRLGSMKSYGQVSVYARDSDGNGQTSNVDIVSGSIATGRSYKRTGVILSDLTLEAYDEEGNYVGNDTGLQGKTYYTSGATYDEPFVGASDNSSGNDEGTHTILCLRWGRVLSRAEIRRVHQNPWQIFKMQPLMITLAEAGVTPRGHGVMTGVGRGVQVGVG